MKVILVVAYGINRVIGKEGKLPDWQLRADMQHFKKTTVGKAVIMGRKTYESFDRKYRPLPDRLNIIVSRNKNYVPEPNGENVSVQTSLVRAISYAQEKGYTEVYIIGGGEIFTETLSGIYFHVDEIIATEIDGYFEGETFFPGISDAFWKKEKIGEQTQNEKNSHAFAIYRYIRK